MASGNVFATMWHGSLESDAFRQEFLGAVAAAAVLGLDHASS